MITKSTSYAMLLGFMIFAILDTMPFADSEKYRKAIHECQKSLPRDRQCVVIGVPK